MNNFERHFSREIFYLKINWKLRTYIRKNESFYLLLHFLEELTMLRCDRVTEIRLTIMLLSKVKPRQD